VKQKLPKLEAQSAIRSFLRNREALDRKPKTLQWYKEQLSRFAKLHPIIPTDPENIEDFLASITGSPATKHAYCRTLKTFYHFISQRYHFPNPFNEIGSLRQPKRVMPTLEPNDMYRLLIAVRDRSERAIITLFLDTGARVSEITSLRWKHIFNASILVDGKTGERLIPISEETRQLLLSLPRHISGSPFVFNNQYGEAMSRFSVYRIVSRLLKEIGIENPKMGPHRLRHTFGKDYLVNGGDTRSLQQIMGHANITTTEQYASLNIKDITEKHHKFTPLRAAYAAAQQNMFDADELVKEAEEIIAGKKGEPNGSQY